MSQKQELGCRTILADRAFGGGEEAVTVSQTSHLGGRAQIPAFVGQ